MIKNYIKVAFRSLLNQKFYSILNVAGLSLGLCCFILIALYVQDELSYDRSFADSERIQRMNFYGEFNGNPIHIALASAPAGEVITANYPEVEDFTRFRTKGTYLIKKATDEASLKVEKCTYADPNFFSFFGISLKHGSQESALEDPKSLALSESLSTRIFGNANPIGQTVTLDNKTSYTVNAVFEDIPANSHFHFDLLLSMEGLEESRQTMWLSINFNTYLKFREGYDVSAFDDKLMDIIKTYIGPELVQFLNVDPVLLEKELNGDNPPTYFSLTPLHDIHLHSDLKAELEPNSDIKYVYIFSAIALFILFLACINFMNLATARSARRAKEVGVRKVMGAYRSSLIYQFLTEALMISMVSAVIALLAAATLLPGFNELASKSLSDRDLFSLPVISVILFITLLVGLLAGSYPAFYLSKFKPVETLKGKLNMGMKSSGIRSTLVILQFTVSISMIIGTAVVYDQLSYIQNKKLGFKKDHVIMVKDAWLLGDKVNAFKNNVLADSRVTNGTVASFLPVKTTSNNNAYFLGETPSNSATYLFRDHTVDVDYIKTLEMEITDGRDFSRDFPTDTAAVIVNQAGVELMGLENPVGTVISRFGGSPEEGVDYIRYKIIGVVENFHFESLRNNIAPFLFKLGSTRDYVSFRMAGDNVPETIEMIKSKWEEISPSQPFDFDFLDERFNKLYESEQRIGSILAVFAFLAIFIACLGLYGLAAFTTEQKTKEIGIRKVLGASVSSIIGLLSREFLKLVAISFVLAATITYFSMSEWLEDFVYRTNIKPLTFVIAGLLAFCIAWITMSIQSYRAAKVNPAKSLKSE